MQFSLPLQSITPSAGVARQPPESLQGLDNFAESGAGERGLFALILSRLDLGEPVASPVAGASGPVVAGLATQIAAADLPPTGNPLPPLPAETLAETLPALRAVAPGPAGQAPGEAVLPLPVLPQPLKQTGASRPALPATTGTPTPALSAMQLQSEPLAGVRDVVVRDASIEVRALRPDLPAVSNTIVAETTQNAVVPQQNTAVAAPLSLSPVPAPAVPAASTTPQHAYALNQPVADPQWGNELGKRLIWMNENGIGRAELRLNPPELGPVEVRIAVTSDDARVAFQVQHGATREALENAMPRLREMFASQGLNLSDANVSEHSAQGRQQTGQSGSNAGGDQPDGGVEQLAGAMTDAPDGVRETPLDGSVDAYV